MQALRADLKNICNVLSVHGWVQVPRKAQRGLVHKILKALHTVRLAEQGTDRRVGNDIQSRKMVRQ